MSTVGIDIVLRGQTEGGKVVKRTLDDVGNSADKATSSVSQLDKQMKATSNTSQLLGRALGGMIAAMGVRELIRMTDSVTMLRGRLENATRGAKEAQQAFDGLRTIAQRTGADMETVVSVFQRLSFVRDEIKATMGEMLQFTDTVSKLGVISGAGQTAMQAGLTQLGQALSANIVRAEEWNSIMENIPAVGVQIAKQFGVTTGQLRQLVVEGKVLSEDVFAAMLNASTEVEKQFNKMPMTIGRAFAALKSDIELFVGGTSDASGAATAMIGVIDLLRIALHGLGAGFNGLVSIVGTAVNLMLKGIQDSVNLAIKSINYLIGLANKVPGVSIDLLKEKNWSSADYTDIFKSGKDDLSKALSDKGPNNTVFDRMLGNGVDTLAKTEREISRDYAAEAAKLAGDKEAIKALEKRYKELESAIKGSRTEEERLLDSIKEMEGMRGLARTAQEAKGLETAIKRAHEELEELRVRAELNGPVARAFQSLASEIDGGFKDAFKSAFRESDGGFKSLLNGWKNVFKDFIAEIAYMAFARPIIMPIVGSIGGMMGLSSNAVAASIAGSTGGTGNYGALNGGGSLLSSGGSMFSMGGSLFSGGLGAGIGNISSSLASGAYGLFSKDAYGALAFGDKVGDFMANAGSWGNIAGGALGGIGASMLGLSNKNAYVNAGLSTIGGIAGSAFGPVGAFAGSFLGSALGGLFGGGKPSDKAQWGSLNLATMSNYGVGGMTGKKYSQENASFRDAVLGEAAKLAQLLQSGGGTSTGSISIHVGSRDGLRIGNHNGANYGNNAKAFTDAVMQMVVNQTTGLTSTFQTILDNVGIKDLAKLSEAFEFGQWYDSVMNPAKAVEEALKAVNTEFDALAERAKSLGLTTVEFTEKLEEQRQSQLGLIKAQQAGFQSMEAMKATFDSWLYDQSLSGTSSLSPLEKLIAAQGNFNGLLDSVRGGDATKTQELLQAGQQLLQLGQSMYASSVEFGLLEKFIRESIGGVAKQLGVPGYAGGTQSARPGLRWVGENGPELVRFNGGERVHNTDESKAMARRDAATDGRFAQMNEQISSMSGSMNRMERQLSRVANFMTVTKKG